MTEPTAASRIGGTAVVVGASMAGLCAARVLADRFDSVLLLDRDTLPGGVEPRDRVPQGRQPHLLLVAGARLLEGWFPGIAGELRAAGAIDLDLSADVYWHQDGGVTRRPRSTLHSPAMSRPLLERTVRKRVEALAPVRIRDRTTVAGLTTDAAGTRVTGVRLQDGSSIAGDLVVDATGRAARSLAWLAELGYPAPPTSVVEIDTRYVSQIYRRDGADPGWGAAVVVDEPAAKRLALALPLEGDRWIVLLSGLNGETPPLAEADRLAYARSFPSPVIAELMAASEPLGEPVTHRFPTNQRRHVKRLRRFPVGWVPLGDAVCSFDPIYGQGMTAAAMQARALGASLDRTGRVSRRFARRYFRAAGRTLAAPWSIAVGGDFVYDGTSGPKPVGTDLLNWYLALAGTAAQHDDAIALRMNEVLALVRRTEALVAPRFVLRVLRFARRGPAGQPEVASSVNAARNRSSAAVDSSDAHASSPTTPV